MPAPSPIFLLALFTLSSSIGFGLWQLRSLEKERVRRDAWYGSRSGR